MLPAVRRAAVAVLVCCLALGAVAPPAAATLILDVRVSGQAGKDVWITHVGQTVNLDLYACIRGSNTLYTDEELRSIKPGLYSPNVNGGAVLGNLWAWATPRFSSLSREDLPASKPVQRDLDGDVDLDFGCLEPDSWYGSLYCRAWDVAWADPATPADFHVAGATFTVTGLLYADPGSATLIRPFLPAYWLAALWMEDGEARTYGDTRAGVVQYADPVRLRLAPEFEGLLPPYLGPPDPGLELLPTPPPRNANPVPPPNPGPLPPWAPQPLPPLSWPLEYWILQALETPDPASLSQDFFDMPYFFLENGYVTVAELSVLRDWVHAALADDSASRMDPLAAGLYEDLMATLSPFPEPGTLALLVLGAAALGGARRRGR